MPKNKKKSKQPDEEEFDDMLAEFWVGDLATASNASRTPATSSSPSTAGTDSRPSTMAANAAANVAANMTEGIVSRDAIVNACISGNLSQLRRWGRQGVRVRTVDPLFQAVLNGASYDVLFCLVGWRRLNQRGGRGHGWTALTAVANLNL
jgi:hypothetical protein